jgi:hypothetical protein
MGMIRLGPNQSLHLSHISQHQGLMDDASHAPEGRESSLEQGFYKGQTAQWL